MGVTKSELFNDRQNELARIMKALAHPARIAIIDCLLDATACITGDLVDETGLAQATISQHLRELKDIGLIKGNIEGVSVRYCIDKERWDAFGNMIQKLFGSYMEMKTPGCGID